MSYLLPLGNRRIFNSIDVEIRYMYFWPSSYVYIFSRPFYDMSKINMLL